MLSVVRDLGYVQWDPVTVVAPSHILSFWSRVGGFRVADLDRLLWKERRLFLHWTPMASLVLTEDFPLFHSLMRRYPDSLTRSWGNQRTSARRFLARHGELRRKILRGLQDGPRSLGQFEDHARTRRKDGEWGFGSDVALMLYQLTMRGEVMVVGHRGNQDLWGLADLFLPPDVDRSVLTEAEGARVAALRALHALGTATRKEIHYYFIRGRYKDLQATLAELEADARIRRVSVSGVKDREPRFVLARDVPLLESLETSDWEPRLSLLPPFDNMVYSPARTAQLFGFEYVREQFLPKAKRRYGTYVLPILWGDRFIGRIDPRLDKATGELVIQAVHAEPGAPKAREVASRIRQEIGRLADFLGASRVTYSSRVPAAWRGSLH